MEQPALLVGGTLKEYQVSVLRVNYVKLYLDHCLLWNTSIAGVMTVIHSRQWSN